MFAEVIECQHCGTLNSAARCSQCERGFVVTTCHIEGRLRDGTAQAVSNPNLEAPERCDFCSFKAAGRPPTENVSAGLRQRTCPSCHTEFLSGHGYQMRIQNERVRELQEANKRLMQRQDVLRDELKATDKDWNN